MATFSNEPGFCPQCGTILPMLGSEGDVKCYNCKQTFGPEGKESRISLQFFTILNKPTKYNCKGNTKKKKTGIQETFLIANQLIDQLIAEVVHFLIA
jgi:hypothetical protein